MLISYTRPASQRPVDREESTAACAVRNILVSFEGRNVDSQYPVQHGSGRRRGIRPVQLEPAGAPPSDLAPAIAGTLEKDGYKILGAGGATVCEIWFRSAIPTGPASTEQNVSIPTLPHGALLGVIRYPARGNDRRGLMIKPGVYTLRYSLFPTNGDHQGIAPQRDFAILVLAAEDQDAEAKPAFEPLMDMGRKASGTPHPLSLSISKSEAEKFPLFEKEGERDWVLNVKAGGLPVAIILIGKYEG